LRVVAIRRVPLSDESVAHALEGWRQAERDETVARDDEAHNRASTPEQIEETQERVVEARDAYELAAERARRRQAPAKEASSVANLDQSGPEPRA
jgi:hypothetical protein